MRSKAIRNSRQVLRYKVPGVAPRWLSQAAPKQRPSATYAALTRGPLHRIVLVNEYKTHGHHESELGKPTLAALKDTEQRLKPFTLTAPTPEEIAPVYSKARSFGAEQKDIRAAPAIALHDRVSSDPQTVAVYSDGSIRADRLAGAAATIPSMNKALLQNAGVLEHVRRSVIAETVGLAAACELAAVHTPPGMKVALFTDGQYSKSFSKEEWEHPLIGRTMTKAYHALRKLEEQDSPVAVYWIPGHRGVVEGIIIAHRLANIASHAVPSAMSNLLLAPVLSAGVAIDHVGVLTLDSGTHQFYLSQCPRRKKRNDFGSLYEDGLSTVSAYKEIREQYVHLGRQETPAEALAYVASNRDPGIEGIQTPVS